MSWSRRALLSGCLVATLATPAAARVGRPVVLESHVGPRRGDAGYFVDYMLRVLGPRASLHGADLRKLIEARHSRPAGRAPVAAGIRQLVEDGRRQFIEGAFKQAIQQLESARRKILERAAATATDQKLRILLHRALLYLAQSYLRDHQGDRAAGLMSEVIRSFPDRDLSMVQFGPRLVKFHRRVRLEMGRQKRGTLTVTTRPRKCLVFLNERFVGLGPARAVDLYPGTYRVYVQRPGERGRIHVVTIAGEDHELTVDFGLDRALRTEPIVRLEYGSQAAKDRDESRHAAAVARAVGSPMALALGLAHFQGRRMLRGAAIAAATGKVIRVGMVGLEPAAPSPRTLEALGTFLITGRRGPGVIVHTAAGATSAGAPGRPPLTTVFKWISLGAAAACLAAGITLLALDGTSPDCDNMGLCPRRYETLAGGATLAALGGAAAVTSGALFYLDARRKNTGRRSAALVPFGGGGGGGLAVFFTF